MKRSERAMILPGVMLLVVAFMLIALRYLPVMSVERIVSQNFPLTPAMRRAASEAIGGTYPRVERRRILSSLDALPYLSNASLSYAKGALVISSEPVSGIVILARDGALFANGEMTEAIGMEDAGALAEVYPVIGTESIADFPLLSAYIPYLISNPFQPSLITWFDFSNNSDDGSAELIAALPELNASVILKNPASAARLNDTIGIIEESCRVNPGRTIFAPSQVYELYNDRLVRLKG
ncbi:MAG: hypothetical protein IAA97_08440 [Spirochaetes bacterium]|uniref:Cell division protein FtsQ n=1 Tax=Candidatus Ornithospirochaeta stercoripullorum TaxID=2840899 RepID=A0A9D9E0K6_9SPIO|nr:hypothetical protein [Candidatus Ornithospirochaeta stercoripullorum]